MTSGTIVTPFNPALSGEWVNMMLLLLEAGIKNDMVQEGDLCPDNPDHNVNILFLEFVTVHAIGIPACPEDSDA